MGELTADVADTSLCHHGRCAYETAQEGVQGAMRTVELGAMKVWSAAFRPTVLRPDRAAGPRPARPDAAPHYHLTLLLEGSALATHGERELPLSVGDFYVDDCALRHEIRTGACRAVGVVLPKALLPLPCDQADTVLGRRMPSRDGVGALLARFLTRLTEETTAYRPPDAQRLGSVLSGMVAALLGCAVDRERALPVAALLGCAAGRERALLPANSRTALLLRIAQYIQQRIADPGLTPRAVAAAHGLSPSYLHRLFQDESTTVAAFIRRLRLERARFDLADPAQGSTSIRAIAARWGFARATDFTRAFRAAYGVPPADYRRHCHVPSGRIAT
ncbi:helix-turn-helix domain-containing protein [Streptomyces sp. CC224B]|uniref:helix-turn-helix domain-containing protein n=1 Tax=Streptomyces sp. CC224B TaxID=3044571 RepID=UPI0024A9B567|nr:helix-turn-helix domain-containing protein [Streptomyces sp. CC224B]